MSPRKSTKIQNNFEYKQAIKNIRPFASGFDGADGYDLRKDWSDVSKYKREKLRRYFDIIQPLTAHPFKAVRLRRADRIRTAQEFSGQTDFPKGMKTAIISVADPSDTLGIKFSKDNKEVTYIVEGVVTRAIFKFNAKLLMSDTEAAIDDLLSRIPKSVKQLMIMADEHLIAKGFSREKGELLKRVIELQTKYGSDKFDPNNTSSHYYGNWLFGVYGFAAKSFGDIIDYRKEMIKVKALLRTARSTRNKKDRKVALKELEKYNLKAYRDRTKKR